MNRERMDFDVVVVGGGPAGLSAAIRLKQLAQAAGLERSVCLLEKGATLGAHSLSGAVFDPIALAELFPNWQAMGSPLSIPVRNNHLLFLTKRHALPLPVPKALNKEGQFIISLGALCRWLGQQATALGVEILTGFAAAELLYSSQGALCGVATGDQGLNRHHQPTPLFQRGVELHAKQTLFAEGCRGFLTEQLVERFALRRECHPQSYGLGIKELWEISPTQHQAGNVVHTLGWPLSGSVHGGGFLYHFKDHLLAVGLIVDLPYPNPWFSPFDAFQGFKTHPAISHLFAGGRRLGYGARTLAKGGYQAIPQLSFPGGVLLGDGAGFINGARLQGIHTAMKSGLVAAEALHGHLQPNGVISVYPARLRASWLWQELYAARNNQTNFRWGLAPGLALSALEASGAPILWTIQPAPQRFVVDERHNQPIHYPKPDGVITFAREESLALANLTHKADQPTHLHLREAPSYGAPEMRYCPAKVFETRHEATGLATVQINAANCLHCKTCDILDPNIRWTPPEGGSGPNYWLL